MGVDESLNETGLRRAATITDVANLAGVSTQTVSNVLNRPERVRPDTAKRVHDAVESLGYRGSAAARRLRTRRSDTIGLRLEPVHEGISGTLLDSFLHELTSRAATLGLRVMLYTAKDHDDEITTISSLLAAGDIDGVVITGTHAGDPRSAWLAEHGVPTVSFGRPWDQEGGQARHPWVDVDGAAGTAAATRHLLGGGRTIAFLGWPGRSGQGEERYRGWHDVMVERGRFSEVELQTLTAEVPDRVELALHAAHELRARHGKLDGVVAASDSLALGAMLALGSDVPIVGFDNTPMARAVGLSSIDQRVDLIAQSVIELLCDDGKITLRGGDGRLLTPELRVRRAVSRSQVSRIS